MTAPESRPLTLFDMTCIGVNAIVGSSIFLFPGKMVGMVGPASIVAFGLTGLLLTTVALCFAEASSHYDQPGGPYLYTREAFGDAAGYGIGWMCWMTEILSLAAVADGVAIYLGFFDPRLTSPWVVKGTAAAVIALMGAVNYRGVKLGAWTSNVLTIAKLLPLAVFVLAGLPHVKFANYVPFAPHGWRPLGSACFLAYFAFQGFEVVPVPAGEVTRAERNIPLAVLFSLALASLVYMLVQAVAVGVHPGLAGAERPLAEAAGIIFGPTGAALLVVGAAVSMTGFCSGAALGGPRYLVALAHDSHLPRHLSDRHPRFGTPHHAVAVTAAFSAAAALFLDFERLVDIGNVVVCAQYLATCAAIPALRRLKGKPGRFHLPGGLALPAVAVLATLWLGAQGGLAQIGVSLVFLAIGFLLRWATHQSRAAA